MARTFLGEKTSDLIRSITNYQEESRRCSTCMFYEEDDGKIDKMLFWCTAHTSIGVLEVNPDGVCKVHTRKGEQKPDFTRGKE